jgi:hypothetical protein
MEKQDMADQRPAKRAKRLRKGELLEEEEEEEDPAFAALVARHIESAQKRRR